MNNNPQPLNEKSLLFLESKIPELAEGAFRLAFVKTLEAGYSVLEADTQGNIYRIFPDGSKKFVKRTEPCIPMTVGKKIKLKLSR